MHLRRKLLRIDFLRRSISEGIVKLRCRYFTTSWPAILRKPCCFGLIRQLVGGMSFAHQITIPARLKSQGHESRPCSYPWERDVLGNSSASEFSLVPLLHRSTGLIPSMSPFRSFIVAKTYMLSQRSHWSSDCRWINTWPMCSGSKVQRSWPSCSQP